jgi:hypothetical protein
VAELGRRVDGARWADGRCGTGVSGVEWTDTVGGWDGET